MSQPQIQDPLSIRASRWVKQWLTSQHLSFVSDSEEEVLRIAHARFEKDVCQLDFSTFVKACRLLRFAIRNESYKGTRVELTWPKAGRRLRYS